jgi:RNA polymerase sigma factor FliA
VFKHAHAYQKVNALMKRKRSRTPLDDVWDEYFATRSTASRDFILKSYMPFVERIARDIMRKKPSNFEKEDLVQSGAIGLLQALEKFDPSVGVLFSTFAALRVRGAIYDEINGMDWTPRLVRERIKLVIRATEEHYKNSQVLPTEDQLVGIIRDSLGKDLSPSQVRQAQEQMEKTYVHAIDHSMVLEHEEKRSGLDVTQRPTDVEELVQVREESQAVVDALKIICTPEELDIVLEIFYNGKSMRAVAEEKSIPVSKVSEIKKKVISETSEVLRENGFDNLRD